MQAGDENFHLTFETPSEEELDEWFAKLGDKVDEVSGQVEDLVNDFADDVNQSGVFEQAMEVVDMVGDGVKSIYDTVPEDQKFWEHDEEAEHADEQVVMKAAAKKTSLAKKSEAAASSNAGMYAGISFGVIGLVAAGAMFAAATKKQVNDNEECLL